MIEPGPIFIWCKDKIPISGNFNFKKIDKGLYYGELTKGNTEMLFTINAK